MLFIYTGIYLYNFNRVAFCYRFVCYNIVLTYLLYVKFVIVRLCVMQSICMLVCINILY